jgi:antitoxin (DNA-binding transcriptional repressor) of toxin-antitoxin stability system
MTMERYDVLYTRNNLSRLISRVEAGEEIEISRRGRPVARLVPIEGERPMTGADMAAWLAANPVPAAQQKTPEEIEETIAEIIEGRKDW